MNKSKLASFLLTLSVMTMAVAVISVNNTNPRTSREEKTVPSNPVFPYLTRADRANMPPILPTPVPPSGRSR